MIVFSSPTGKKEALRSEIAWTALLRDVRSASLSGLHATQQTRKKRSLESDDISDMPGGQDKKVRCRRHSTAATKDVLFNGTNSTTFLDLSPPTAKVVDDVRFIFGRQHYTTISLPTLSKSDCGCNSGSREFDVFSSYRCPCNHKKIKRSATAITGNNKRDKTISSAQGRSVCL